MNQMLHISKLDLRYGEIQAVESVDIEINLGEIVSITGANGAGKSSVLNAISGIHRPSGGDILFEGENIAGLKAHAVVRKGIVQVPEGRQLFATLSVRENLLAGCHTNSGFVLNRNIPEQILSQFPVLRDRLDSLGSSLSGGQAQMLALARGLMNSPKLLLLDEPTLAPIAVSEVFKLISRLRDQGLTILLVEQNVRQALAISDRAYVLESGRTVMEGTGQALLNDDRLVQAYLGINQRQTVYT